MKSSSWTSLTFVVVATVMLAGCGRSPGHRALTGAAIGAGTGAVVGSVTGIGPGGGALIGGGVGAAVGGLTSPNTINLAPH